ncbi:hypothetical protein AB6A40_006477 [Gnathostoma spinigerum]|uniref:Uncharacterized protein n=1 Tax=Gnathostoma spinigerum TaxID=75299 RepID=A0ABD6ERX6_9BILA
MQIFFWNISATNNPHNGLIIFLSCVISCIFLLSIWNEKLGTVDVEHQIQVQQQVTSVRWRYKSWHFYGNFSITKEERKILTKFSSLFLLPSKDEIILMATTEVNGTGVQIGNVSIIRMEYSITNDYIKFFHENITRAVYGVQTTNVSFGGVQLKVPKNTKSFLRKWQKSEFIECLGLNVSSGAPSVIPKHFVRQMAIFRDFFEAYESGIFLFGGTLLGWYRECMFIDDTTDVDFAMSIREVTSHILDDMKCTKRFRLHWILGKVGLFSLPPICSYFNSSSFNRECSTVAPFV